MSAAEGSTATVAQLMQRSLLDVFNERDAERRAAIVEAPRRREGVPVGPAPARRGRGRGR